MSKRCDVKSAAVRPSPPPSQAFWASLRILALIFNWLELRCHRILRNCLSFRLSVNCAIDSPFFLSGQVSGVARSVLLPCLFSALLKSLQIGWAEEEDCKKLSCSMIHRSAWKKLLSSKFFISPWRGSSEARFLRLAPHWLSLLLAWWLACLFAKSYTTRKRQKKALCNRQVFITSFFSFSLNRLSARFM